MVELRTPKPVEPFVEWEIPRREMPHLLAGHYRVYKDEKNYATVKAESALEALQITGMKQAYRIEREALYTNNVLSLSALQQSAEIAETIAAASAAALAAVTATDAATETTPAVAEVVVPPAAVPPASGPLSSDQVDQLMKS